ncbi:hypothetical protein ILUMI_19088 [Ignelater luminosus]|uniref:Partial AB-hydrolase lipase domain-containing protein n=1 Tax=Ignelater luminosus TaxID=2038154 RepID=A0A8K0G094_IGNLU|nr:hypothetical protein ILUMI_19088 [Ignelater luminosus]
MLSKIIIFVALVVFTNGYDDYEVRRPPPDTCLNVKQLIEKYRYPFENHTVQTEDGYMLQIHRIPHGRNSNGNITRPAVLVVPGVLGSSADWVNMGPERSLGFILADEGYDVWLANTRGTRWSRKHAWLDPDVDKKEYWTFSFQQIGEYDLPELIDHILDQTNQEKLFYIGHSQGTTSFFALTSTKPEYNKKVRLTITLAPAAYAGHMRGLLINFFAIFEDQIAVQGLHYAQLFKSKKFRKYDYGEEKNLEIYGQSSPPDYDLSRITAPLAMYYGDKDLYCNKEDVDRTAAEVSNLVTKKVIKGFNHLDVLWGIDVVQLVFKDVIELMKQY